MVLLTYLRTYGLIHFIPWLYSWTGHPSSCNHHPFHLILPHHHTKRYPPIVHPPVDVTLWIPWHLIILSVIQALWSMKWLHKFISLPKYYCIDGLNFCIMTHQGRVPKALLPFLCPTGATIHQHELHICSVPESPQQTIFDTDATKFLIDSTASAHMWTN